MPALFSEGFEICTEAYRRKYISKTAESERAINFSSTDAKRALYPV
jgi:hypothetical protein